MEQKVVHMVLKVDLQCHRCYKKVRNILCKIPQIRDQVYDEKQGTVLIKVVCCTPEKIMNKISFKGDRSIESIHMKDPKKKEEIKDKEAIPEPKNANPRVMAQPDQDKRPPQPPSISNSPLYEGRPSYQYHDYGIPAMAPPSYAERAIYDSYGGEDNRTGYNVGQSSDYYEQQNSTSCSIL